MIANHMTCALSDCRLGGVVRRGEAVIRSDGRTQRGYHADCYTLHRAVGDIVVVEVPVMPLTRRLEAARLA